MCGATSTSGVSVDISDSPCSNCSALTISGENSYQANAYGGSMSVVHVGAYAWTVVAVGQIDILSLLNCNITQVTDLSVVIADSTMLLTKAVSSKHRQFCVCLHL
jgi:hypothetical protein